MAGIGSSIAGGITQSNAAQAGAQAQESKAQQAQQLELQNQQAGVNFQTGEWNQQQANEQPYLQEGATSANSLGKLLQQGFTAPTLSQAEQTPGYQFNLQQGTQAINEQGAATGNLLSGNQGVALEKYGQGLATNTYQQAYNNALQQYTTNANSLLAGTGVGQTAVGQLGSEGQAAANNLSNLYLTGGQQQASQLNNQGAAIAAGDIGSANAMANMYNGIGSGIQQGLVMNALGNYSSAPYDQYTPGTGAGNVGSVGGQVDSSLSTPQYMPAPPPSPYGPYQAPPTYDPAWG